MCMYKSIGMSCNLHCMCHACTYIVVVVVVYVVIHGGGTGQNHFNLELAVYL